MTKKYKGSFDYTTASDDYECTMKSGIPWWIWPILGVVLLFIASLFVRWDREITVNVVDDMNRPIEQADVAVNYTARFCPWLKKDIAIHAQTNAAGKVVIRNMPVSVWSYLFYHNEPVKVKGEKYGISETKTVPLHSTEKVVIKLTLPHGTVDIDVRTLDVDTEEAIEGARLFVTIDGVRQPDIITTDNTGRAIIENVHEYSMVSVAARHPDYAPNDTTIYEKPASELHGKINDIPMRRDVAKQVPKTNLSVRTIDALKGTPISGAELVVTVDGNGRPDIITTGPDGRTTIPDVPERSIISVAARHPNYNPNDFTISNEPVANLKDKETDIPMTPKINCNETVECTYDSPSAKFDNIDLGRDNADFTFTYDTQSLPDWVKVWDANGNLIFDTKDYVSTYGSYPSVRLHSPTRYISVQIDANDPGTYWEFKVGCAK